MTLDKLLRGVRSLVLSSALAYSACGGGGGGDECERDSDCEGDRVCERDPNNGERYCASPSEGEGEEESGPECRNENDCELNETCEYDSLAGERRCQPLTCMHDVNCEGHGVCDFYSSFEKNYCVLIPCQDDNDCRDIIPCQDDNTCRGMIPCQDDNDCRDIFWYRFCEQDPATGEGHCSHGRGNIYCCTIYLHENDCSNTGATYFRMEKDAIRHNNQICEQNLESAASIEECTRRTECVMVPSDPCPKKDLSVLCRFCSVEEGYECR